MTLVLGAGCTPAKSTPPASPAVLMIKVAGPSRPVEPGRPIPSSTVSFQGARGNVRITVEIGGDSGSPTINDVLFRAEGAGKLSLILARSGPDQKPSLSVNCQSGGEDSTAEVDSGTLLADPTTTIGVELPFGDDLSPISEGVEVVLARYSIIGRDRTTRLTWKGIFSREPIAPRVKAGMKASTP